MSILSKLQAGLRRPFDGLRGNLRRRRARRAAEINTADQELAKRLIAEELARQERLAEERAREEEAAVRREVETLARQKRLAQERADEKAARQRAIEEEAAELRRIANPFQLGERYENRKGPYTVIGLSGDKIRIRWDSGEEITDTIESQARILRNMERDDVYCEEGDPPVGRYRDLIAYCSYCGRPLTTPHYYNGEPYGSTCIRHVRGW